MELQQFSSDWLLDVFIHIDFAKQCELRRTCRKWNSLCRTNFVLRNMVLKIATRRCRNRLISTDSSRRQAISQVARKVENVVFIDHLSPKEAQCLEKSSSVLYDANIHSIITAFALRETSSVEQRLYSQRHLFIVNIPFMVCRSLQLAWYPIFHTITLHNVGLVAQGFFMLLFSEKPAIKPATALAIRCLWLLYSDAFFPTVVVPSASLSCSTSDRTDSVMALRQLYVDNMPSLDEHYRNDLQCRLRSFDQADIRTAISVLASQFQPELQVNNWDDLDCLNYDQFCPVILWLLYGWDGVLEPLEDDDENEGHELEDYVELHVQ